MTPGSEAEPENAKPFYFRNLNGLRFFAAFLVIIEHSSTFANAINPTLSNFTFHQLPKLGNYGVKFFFVLSGFLITYLLLREVEQHQKVSIKNFYIRRILRIWPLYFLVGIGGTIAGPIVLNKLGVPVQGNIATNLSFVALFAVNLQLVFSPFNRGIVEILWSVCLEEQFYLIWAPAFQFFKKRVLMLSVLSVAIGLLTPVAFDFFATIYNGKMHRPNYYFTTSAFTFFGLGSFASYSLKHELPILKTKLFSKAAQLGVLLTLALMIPKIIPMSPGFERYWSNLSIGLLFVHIILSAVSDNSLLNLEFRPLIWLGKISYGLYLYHTVVLQILVRILYKFSPNGGTLVYEFLLPLLGLGITAFISHISFFFFETKFLRMKDKFR